MKEWKSARQLLDYLNETYSKLHTAYEDAFWIAYMGDQKFYAKKDKALQARDAFRADKQLMDAVLSQLDHATGEEKGRLLQWKRFFSLYQVPASAQQLKDKINLLETKIESKRTSRTEGYIDPHTKKFIKASINKMRSMSATHDDEAVRKACFDAIQQLAASTVVKEYVQVVQLRNQFAKKLGYEDFYAYKLDIENGMTKKDLFPMIDKIYRKTSYAFKNIRELERTEKPNLRKPWNYGYMLAGSFTKEEDPYYPFEEALVRWGTSFAAMGINYKGGTLVLDLLDREGKFNNGFCQWPESVRFDGNKRIPGRSHFTCNVVLGNPGQSHQGMVTLFHEGGHAAHLLNCENRDVCLNNEYPPASTSWDETQSMFLDSVFGSVEWASRYAKNAEGKPYPFSLYEREVKELGIIRPLAAMGMMLVPSFEREIYETKQLTPAKVLSIAKKAMRKYTDRSVDSISLLEIIHIYSWESACSYHNYLLADLAVTQWRKYFYDKYGHIVDNPNVGIEMERVWRYGSLHPFKKFVKMATGKNLSADPYIEAITRSDAEVIKKAKQRIAALEKKPRFKKKIKLNAHITMVDGKKTIADSSDGFEAMAKKYATWLKTKYPKKI